MAEQRENAGILSKNKDRGGLEHVVRMPELFDEFVAEVRRHFLGDEPFRLEEWIES